MLTVEHQQVSKEIWSKKYQLKSKHGVILDNTMQDTKERVARALSKNEKDPEHWYKEFMFALNNGAIPAGRILSNAGAEEHKPSTSLINCTVSRIVEDSIEGIVKQACGESAITLSSGAGIGYEFSTLRPKGAFVRGAGSYTSGPLPFMDIFDSMCFTISSAGGRRGAQMATFAVWHPDVEAFISAKREDGRLRQFNLSLLIDDEFMEAVIKNKDWKLVFPVMLGEKNEEIETVWKPLFWDKEYCDRVGYTVEDHKILCKVYKTIRAQDLWDKIMNSTYNFAEPGFLLVDAINKLNNNYWCENIRATNPCLHGDSLVETVEGRVKIKDIKEPTMVYTMLSDGSLGVKKASASWCSKKDAETLKITLNSGKQLVCTSDHLIFVKDVGWKRADELKVKDPLVHLCRSRRGVAYSGVKLSTQDNREYKMEHRLVAEAVLGRPLEASEDVHHIDGDSYNNCIDNLEVMLHSEHSSVTRKESPNNHQVWRVDGKFQITSNEHKKTIVPMPNDLKSNLMNQNSACIKSIEQGPVTDVYDISVEDTHNFVADFVVVHNCGEQPLPPFGSCLLGSINLVEFVLNPFGANASFDWVRYEKVVRIFTRLLDNVVEINGLPLPQQQEEILTKRRHGMGLTGVGSALSLMGIKYGSKEAVGFTGEVMKRMAVIGFKEGVSLAKEKGPAPILSSKENRESFVESEYLKRVWEVWPEGREEILSHGCRFTHHTSIAPTGTISLSFGNNVSNGIEPSFSHMYTRNVIQEGKKSKSAETVFSYEALCWNAVKGNSDFPDYFVTTDNIHVKQHVDMQAAAQYWCDSSISKTINVPTDIAFEEFKDTYIYAYEKGLKGCTTFRFNPEAFQGVLVKEDDLKETTYIFTLEDGMVIKARGNETIEYDGEEHSAANLYDAIKEGYYGKY